MLHGVRYNHILKVKLNELLNILSHLDNELNSHVEPLIKYISELQKTSGQILSAKQLETAEIERLHKMIHEIPESKEVGDYLKPAKQVIAEMMLMYHLQLRFQQRMEKFSDLLDMKSKGKLPNWDDKVDIAAHHFFKTKLGEYVSKMHELQKLHDAMDLETRMNVVEDGATPRQKTTFDKDTSRMRDELQAIKNDLNPEELMKLQIFDIREKSEIEKVIIMMTDNEFNRFITTINPSQESKKMHEKKQSESKVSDTQIVQHPNAVEEQQHTPSTVKKRS